MSTPAGSPAGVSLVTPAPAPRTPTAPLSRSGALSDTVPVSEDAHLPGYTSEKLIRRGAWGEVYAGTGPDQRPVILKVFFGGEVAAAMARREYDAIRTCRHPAIPEALELDLAQERPVLAIERAPGVTLDTWLESGLPPLAAFLKVARQVGS